MEDGNYFRKIADGALVGLATFDASTLKCHYMNSLAKDIFSCHGDIHCISLNDLLPLESRNKRYPAVDLEMLQTEGLYQDVSIKRCSGQTFIAQCGVRHVSTGDGRHILLMVQDTTYQAKLHREVELKSNEIREAYEELLNQNQQLKELDRAKDRFVALVTHELRTPIGAIFGTADILKNGLYDTAEELKEFIEMIHSESKHVTELVNDILDFAKIQAGRMDFYIENKDAFALTKSAVESLSLSAQSAQIQMKLKPREETLCYFDDLRLKQVIENLLSNAVKYNQPGGRVDVWLEENGKQVSIHIKDSGKGIATEDQDKIFNEFETLGKMSLHSKGTGLGLPITKRLIEQMGGTIQFTSEVGMGSHFRVVLPKDKVLSDESVYRSRDDVMEDLAA